MTYKEGSSSCDEFARGHDRNQVEFASIETAIREFRAGRMIVVVDDEDRENEGDLTIYAGGH